MNVNPFSYLIEKLKNYTADKIPFNNTGTSLSSNNVEGAIKEIAHGMKAEVFHNEDSNTYTLTIPNKKTSLFVAITPKDVVTIATNNSGAVSEVTSMRGLAVSFSGNDVTVHVDVYYRTVILLSIM